MKGGNDVLMEWLQEPSLNDCDMISSERLAVHRDILARKPTLKEVFEEFHRCFLELDGRYFGSVSGARIELGAGVSPVCDSYAEVYSSDVVPAGHLDVVVDAQRLPFGDGVLRAIYGQNCSHHFLELECFLQNFPVSFLQEVVLC